MSPPTQSPHSHSKLFHDIPVPDPSRLRDDTHQCLPHVTQLIIVVKKLDVLFDHGFRVGDGERLRRVLV